MSIGTEERKFRCTREHWSPDIVTWQNWGVSKEQPQKAKRNARPRGLVWIL